MRLVIISDTHGLHEQLTLPPGGVLIHAGDSCRGGHFHELSSFLDWFGDQPHPHKILIAGNHDWAFQKVPALAREKAETVCTYLQDEELVIDGVKFYGSPWQPDFCSWAFNLPRGEALARKWAQIPADCDVLITHGPPAGILDQVWAKHCGCEDLRAAVFRIKPRLHVFGHIHYSYGARDENGTMFRNAALCNEGYKLTNDPFIIDI